MNAIDPHVGQVVDVPEPKQVPAARMGIGRRCRLAPVPGHAVVAGKDFLDDAGHPGWLRLRPGRLEPLFLPSDVRRIGRQQPAVAIEGNDGGTPRLRGGTCSRGLATACDSGPQDQQDCDRQHSNAETRNLHNSPCTFTSTTRPCTNSSSQRTSEHNCSSALEVNLKYVIPSNNAPRSFQKECQQARQFKLRR